MRNGTPHRNTTPGGTGGGGTQAEEGVSLHPAQILGMNMLGPSLFSSPHWGDVR